MKEIFNAYYYSFEATGCEPVDNILRAVARAGKSYHHTDCWSDPPYGDPKGKSEADHIQDAANDAAEAFASREGTKP